ncbi:MAG TPA: hypothetical protein VMH24_07625 [Candidatus Sulfotelmatobacter sp.]|nr:hypothetical protein [Candidatus Sulfotelmatobacter sp.]
MTDDLERRLREPPPDLPATIRPLDLGPSPDGRMVVGAGRMSAAGGRLPLALLVVGLVVAGILASYGAWSRPNGGVGGPSPSLGSIVTPSPTASASSAATPEPSPTPASPSPSASYATTTVTVPLGGTHAVVVTIEDQSGELVGARPMTRAQGYQVPPSYGDSDIAAWNPTGKPSTEVWLFWGGVICDTTTQLVIGLDVTGVMVTDGPYPACDTSNDGRGLILTFSRPVDAAAIRATLVIPPPTQ